MKYLFTVFFSLKTIISLAQVTDTIAKTKFENEVIYTVVEKMPEFPGGMEAIYKFITSKTQYPILEKKENYVNCVKVYARFIVTKNGDLKDITIMKTIPKDVDDKIKNEVLRVITAMPKWTPGEHKEEKVNVNYILPISFLIK